VCHFVSYAVIINVSVKIQEFLGFLAAVAEAVAGKKITDSQEGSEAAQQCLQMLDKLHKWSEEVEPADQQQRFGNKAYRTWHARLQEVLSFHQHEINNK